MATSICCCFSLSHSQLALTLPFAFTVIVLVWLLFALLFTGSIFHFTAFFLHFSIAWADGSRWRFFYLILHPTFAFVLLPRAEQTELTVFFHPHFDDKRNEKAISRYVTHTHIDIDR